MTGGSVSRALTSLALSRQREIDEHRAAVETLKSRGEALQARVESIGGDLAPRSSRSVAEARRARCTSRTSPSPASRSA